MDSDEEFIDDRQAEFELWLNDPDEAERLEKKQMEETRYIWGDKFLKEGLTIRSEEDLKQFDDICSWAKEVLDRKASKTPNDDVSNASKNFMGNTVDSHMKSMPKEDEEEGKVSNYLRPNDDGLDDQKPAAVDSTAKKRKGKNDNKSLEEDNKKKTAKMLYFRKAKMFCFPEGPSKKEILSMRDNEDESCKKANAITNDKASDIKNNNSEKGKK